MCFDIQRVRVVCRLRRLKTKRLHGLTFGLILGDSWCVMVCVRLNIGLHGVDEACGVGEWFRLLSYYFCTSNENLIF